jgi:hypothetical protein
MEQIDRHAASFFGTYRVTSIEKNTIRGFRFAIAECEARSGRRHRRLIADDGNQPELTNRPLFYADTYQIASEKTYVYARHATTPIQFFTLLNTLLDAENLREFESREYRAIFNIDGEQSERSIKFPYFDKCLQGEGVRFCRLFFPFGDVAIEFGQSFASSENELDDARRYRILTKKLESPLIGCDLTKTLALSRLLVETHWTANQLSNSILHGMVDEVARAAVAV